MTSTSQLAPPLKDRAFGQVGRRRQADERRMELSNEEYVKAHDLELYLVEALKHVANTADVDAAPNRHIEAAAEYFQAVATARHVAGREFAFVQSTERNRMAFLVAVERACAGMPSLSSRDWHAVLLLVCPDLPSAVTEAAFLAATAAEAVYNSRATRGGSGDGAGGAEGAKAEAGAGGGAEAGMSTGDDDDDDDMRGGGRAGGGGGEGSHDGATQTTTTLAGGTPNANTLSFRALYPALQIAVLYRRFLERVRERVFAQSDFTGYNAEKCRVAIEAIRAENSNDDSSGGGGGGGGKGGKGAGGGAIACPPGDAVHAAITGGAYKSFVQGAGGGAGVGSSSTTDPADGDGDAQQSLAASSAAAAAGSFCALDRQVLTYQRFFFALCRHPGMRSGAAGAMREYWAGVHRAQLAEEGGREEGGGGDAAAGRGGRSRGGGGKSGSGRVSKHGSGSSSGGGSGRGARRG